MTVVHERLGVNLTRRSSQALAWLSERTGDSKTDCVNRALQLYRMIESETGGDSPAARLALIRPNGDVESVRLM